MKLGAMRLAALALLAACGERAAITEAGGRAMTPGGRNASSSVAASGSADFTTVGAATFTVPEGVTSLSIVAIGGGGGGSISHI